MIPQLNLIAPIVAVKAILAILFLVFLWRPAHKATKKQLR